MSELNVNEQEELNVPQKPTFDVFCVKVCNMELERIEFLRKNLKKAKKDYIELLEQFKLCKNAEEAEKVANPHPELMEMYNNLDAEMLKVGEELAAHAERAQLAEELEQNIDENKGESNESN